MLKVIMVYTINTGLITRCVVALVLDVSSLLMLFSISFVCIACIITVSLNAAGLLEMMLDCSYLDDTACDHAYKFRSFRRYVSHPAPLTRGLIPVPNFQCTLT